VVPFRKTLPPETVIRGPSARTLRRDELYEEGISTLLMT
jgi:hypothetical protein